MQQSEEIRGKTRKHVLYKIWSNWPRILTCIWFSKFDLVWKQVTLCLYCICYVHHVQKSIYIYTYNCNQIPFKATWLISAGFSNVPHRPAKYSDQIWTFTFVVHKWCQVLLTVYSCLPWRNTLAQHGYSTSEASHLWQLWHSAGMRARSHQALLGSQRCRDWGFSTRLIIWDPFPRCIEWLGEI